MFRDIALHAPTMLWMTNEQGGMVFLNERNLQFTGLSHDEAVKPEAWVSHVHAADREHAMGGYMRALKQQAAFKLEYRLRRYDGVFRQMLDIAEPRADAAGTFSGYIGCTIDITEQKNHEAALVESNHQIERQTKEMVILYDMKADLQVCRSLVEIKPVLSRYGRELFAGRAVAIYLYNNSRNLVEPFVSWGVTDPAPEMFAPDQCWSLRKRKPHREQRIDEARICPNSTTCPKRS